MKETLMECSEPGAIRDEELLAYLAGEPVRPAVKEHLAHCQSCSDRLAEYRRMELTLTSKLYRWDCPPAQILGEYQLGLLSNDIAAAVQRHLDICVRCAAEVAALNEFLATDASSVERAVPAAQAQNHHRRSPAPVQGAKAAFERLIDASGAGVRRVIATLVPPSPRLAFQRGAANEVWPRRYSAEDLNISIQVEPGTNRRDSLQLIGFVTRSGSTLEALKGIPVLLSSPTNTVYTQNVDELGNFVFTSIAPATYTLELRLPESTIVIDALPVTLQD
jgi:anti-sigma factor RsiW